MVGRPDEVRFVRRGGGLGLDRMAGRMVVRPDEVRFVRRGGGLGLGRTAVRMVVTCETRKGQVCEAGGWFGTG